MTTPTELIVKALHIQVLARIQELLNIADKCYPNHDLSKLDVKVAYRSDMRDDAGYAHTDNNENQIEFNVYLFLSNFDKFLVDTIPHELAHVITDHVFPDAKQSHGPEWKSVMHSLGFNPVRKHTYDVSVIPGSKNKFRYVCSGCTEPMQFLLTKLLHTRISAGNDRLCGVCHTKISYSPL